MSTPKTKDEIFAEMNAAAGDAKKEFEDMCKFGEFDNGTLKSLAGWWERWFSKAGHKRLAYILMGKPMPERK